MKSVCIAFFILCSGYIRAEQFDIRYLTNNDGLSNSSVTSIMQDSAQILWFGTWDGLNMYNGREFTVFKPDENANSISNNIIRNILEARRGTLWIATDNGINRYHVQRNIFDRFFYTRTPLKESSFSICKNKNNMIFAAVYQLGIFYFDETTEQFELLKDDTDLLVNKMFFDRNGFLWIHSGRKEVLQVKIKYNSDNRPEIVSMEKIGNSENIESVFYDTGGTEVWVQTTAGDVLKYSDNQSKSFVKVMLFASKNVKSKITSILFSDKYHLIGTTEGLYRLDKASGKIYAESENVSVLSFFEGTQDIIWVGTDSRGVLMLTPEKEKFTTYSSDNLPDFEIAPVRAFWEEPDGTVWVGTKGSGLYAYHLQDKKADKKAHFMVQSGLLSNSVYALEASDHTLWVGTEGSELNYVDLKTNRLSQLLPKEHMNLSSVYAIYLQNDTTMWLGTSGYGLCVLHLVQTLQTYEIRDYKQYVFDGTATGISNNVVYSIEPDDENTLWIGTRGGGLNRFDMRTETFKAYRSSIENGRTISNDDILCLNKDKNGTLWIGTSMGLNRLVRGEGDSVFFRRYTERNGMPNNTVHGILEDSIGNVWVSTNKGIAKLITESEQIVCYYQSDGLQNNEFSDGAYHASPNSRYFYFGGIGGFNRFDPSKITIADYVPSLHLDAFFVNNNAVNLNDYLFVSGCDTSLRMKYDHRFFSFKFTPVDYIAGSKCEIGYILEGYDKEWIQMGTSGTIVFSNLPPGKYTLKVRCSNANKIPGNKLFILPLEILPPWWLSKYAYTAYIVLFICLFLLVQKILNNRLEMKHKLELRDMEAQKVQEIHQAKLRFFTNIAHEFCNSLTLIYGPAEQLLKITDNDDPKIRKYVDTIKSNAERMQGLIKQLMDFRKAETGYLDLNIESTDIPELVKYTADYFIDLAEQKHIKFDVVIHSDVDLWPTDRNSFEKILFNLLSNAGRSPESSVLLEVETAERELIFSVTNSGPGIREEDQKIFNRFSILERFEEQVMTGFETRTGIGLALCKALTDILKGSIEVKSKIDDYTSFRVSLPRLDLTQRETQISEKAAPKHRITDHRTTMGREKEPTGQKPTIMILEDDRELRFFLADILGDKYDILQAEDGKTGLEVLEKKIPDLFICDLIMPRMSGPEFMRHIKSREVTAHIPIIILSSETSVESQIAGFETGADAYLGKPFHARHLEAIIDQLLNTRKDLKKYYDSPISSIENVEGKSMHKEEKEFILRLTKILLDRIDDNELSLDVLSAEAGISKMQLYRKLKEITGQTPTEFIRRVRLKKAEKLLISTTKTVQEIMFSCGFNNKAYFYREFTKLYRQTPKMYRENKNREDELRTGKST